MENDINIVDELKKITRRLDELEKNLTAFNGDRDLLEDILLRVSALESAIHLNREHQTTVKHEMTAEIREVQHTAQDLKDTIEDKTVIVKSNNKSLFSRLTKLLKREVK